MYRFIYSAFLLFLATLTLPGPAEVQSETGQQPDLATNPASRQPDQSLERAEAMVEFIPEVVATVDENPVTGNLVRAFMVPELTAMIKDNSALPEASELHQMARQITLQLVDQALLFRASRQAGFKPTLQEATEHVEKLEAQLGEERFAKALDQQRLNRAQFLDQTASTIALRKWLEHDLMSKITVSEEEVENFYKNNQQYITEPDQVEVSHILIALEDSSNQEQLNRARRKAESIAALIRAGDKTFGEMASRHSDCPSSRNQGRLPPFAQGEMVPEFEQAAFASQPGQLTEPIQTEWGLHLILKHRHLPARQLPYHETREELKNMLESRQLNDLIENILEQQREQASIDILLQP